MGFFDKIKQGLTKTRDALSSTLGNVFTANEIDDDFYDELEEALILAARQSCLLPVHYLVLVMFPSTSQPSILSVRFLFHVRLVMYV